MMIFFRFSQFMTLPILLLLCLTLEAQEEKDTIKQKSATQYAFLVDPLHLSLGDYKLNAIIKKGNRWAFDLDLGYINNGQSFIYNKYVTFSEDQIVIENKKFYARSEGYGADLAANYFLKGNLKKGNFVSITFVYNRIKYFDVYTYHKPGLNSSPVCDYCYIIENIVTNTFAGRVGYGWHRKLSGKIYSKIFINIGYKLGVNQSSIHSIDINPGFFGKWLYFNDYHIKYYQHLPSVDMGVKIGWAK